MVGKYKVLKYIKSKQDKLSYVHVVTVEKDPDFNELISRYDWYVECMFKSGIKMTTKCFNEKDVQWFFKNAGVTQNMVI